MAEGLLAIPGHFKAGIESAVRFGSEIQDLSRAADLSTEAFQVLAREARLSGAEMGDVSKAIVNIGEKARDAILGEGKAAAAFAQLHVDAKSFLDLAPERQIETLGQAYAGASDKGAAFSALLEIIGTKQAPKLRAMLEEVGTQGLGKLAAGMAESGEMMRDGVIKTMDELGDKNEDLATKFKVAWGDVAVAFKPVFDVFLKLGSLLADLMGFIGRSLEKIGIAAGTIGAMVSDLVGGDFKSFAFYNAEAEKLSAEVDKRRAAPFVGTTPPTSGSGNDLATKGGAKDDLKDLREQVERSQRMAAVDLAAIGRDFALTNDQKRAATVAVLRKEAAAIDKAQKDLDAVVERLARADPRFAAMQTANPDFEVSGIADALSRGPAANKDLASAVDARRHLTDTQSGVTQGILGANQNPMTVAEGVDAALTRIQDRWGTLATQMSDSLSMVGDTITGSLANGMDQLLGTTDQWTQKLGSIAGPIMGSITGAISKMFAEWIVGRTAAAAKNIALSIQEGAAAAPGALFKSIESFGIAAALGLAGFMAAKALGGGFFAGGFTGLGHPHEPAGIVHKGEFVIPHDVVTAVGPGALGGLVENVRNPGSSSSFGGANGGGDEPLAQPMRIIAVFDDGSDATRQKIDRMASHPSFRTHVMRVAREGKAELGLRS
jgi:hypothetical protein